jgi:hypothetical protein
MRRAVLVLAVIAFMATPLLPASAARQRDPLPTVEILKVTGPQPGPEGESEFIFHIDAHDPNGVITEVIVEFGDNSIVFAHTYCVIFGPGEVAHMQIGHAYEAPGTYTVQAWAISVSNCSGRGHYQESKPDVEQVTISF